MNSIYKMKQEYMDRLNQYIDGISREMPKLKAEWSSQGLRGWEIRELLNKRYGQEMIAMSNMDEDARYLAVKEIANQKIDKLISLIKERVGEILEWNLYDGDDGEYNGTVKGTLDTVTVTTILAGGYNIQRLHFRTLIK